MRSSLVHAGKVSPHERVLMFGGNPLRSQHMHFKLTVVFIALSGLGWVKAAGLPKEESAHFAAAGESLESLTSKLGDESYKIREDATLRIWKAGESALPALRACLEGDDPEIAHRAGELIWRIELVITPETEPGVIKLIERYTKGQANEKIRILNELIRVKAWKQILKLYATEKNTDVREQFQGTAQKLAILAARECLIDKDPQAAKQFLEMAPNNAAGLLTLADFHRSQGTSDAELQRVKAALGEKSISWQLAFNRAAGNLQASRETAQEAGETKISEALAALMGDPLPWLRADLAMEKESAVRRAYINSVIRQWEGQDVRPSDLELIKGASFSKNDAERLTGIHLLFLLGQTRDAEKALMKHSPFEAFTYFESLERVDEALEVLNLDPRSPQFSDWIKKRVGYLSIDQEVAENDKDDVANARLQLVTMANFLERRGFDAQAEAAFKAPIELLAKENTDLFIEFLGDLIGAHKGMIGAPMLAKRLVSSWAGDDESRWQLIVETAFGSEQPPISWWHWLGELSPTTPAVERFEVMLALFDLTPDPRRAREKWLALAWDAVAKLPENEKSKSLGLLSYLANEAFARGTDAAFGIKVWDAAAKGGNTEENWGNHVFNLASAERWNEAAEFFLRQIATSNEIKQEPRPVSYAYAAACLRLAKREAEADLYDSWADQLALGNSETALQIGQAYAFGRQYRKAHEWWMRAAIQCDANSETFPAALQLISDGLQEAGQWKLSAAINELLAQNYSSYDQIGLPPTALLRVRMQADMGRALVILDQDRAKATVMLEKCHDLFPSEGSLADSFFPVLRRVGLIPLHDRLFEISWNLVNRSIQQYPTSENTYNTAAWLASRAKRNLDPAQKLLEKALEMNPDQPAYLDTMAEIQFAKGNRAEALEWSSKATNFSPQDSMIRRQHERFRSEPLPR
jgi:tetratricopeptide (TPR) repeat protein